MNQPIWNPGSLIGLSGSYWQVCTLHTGVKLNMFTIIGENKKTAEDITREINGDIRGTTALLQALTAMKLLIHDKGCYANTPETLKFLVASSPGYIGHMIMHHHHLMDGWNRMSESVLTGKPVRTSASDTPNEDKRESFLMGMFNIASVTAPDIADAVDLKGCQRLLDLGGGPGTFAIHFCQKHPELKADVFDLETTRPFAEATIERFGLTDRIEFTPFNYLQDTMAEDTRFDAAWLSHILHGEGPDDAEMIIQKAVSALSPGGKIIIHEFILTDDGDAPLFPALFNINMLVGTPSGRSYTEGQLRDMLARQGVKDIIRLDYVGPTEAGILVGYK